MAWVSGVFSRLHNWVNDRDANIKILATRHDAEDDNLAAGINNTLTKDGQNTPTANLPMGNFRHTGVGSASARTDYPSAAQIQDSGTVYATDTGTADNYAISLIPAITAYTLGNRFWFKALNTNTGASTLNVNGLGTKSIVRTVSTVLIAGDIKANGIYGVFYDGTNFQLINLAPFVPDVVSGENAAVVITTLDTQVVIVTTLTLTDVLVGDRLEYHYWVRHIKGSTAALTTLIAVVGGTSTIVWGDETTGQPTPRQENRFQQANEDGFFAGIHRRGICTVAGTYTISSEINSAGSTGNVGTGEGQAWLGIVSR